MMHNGQLDGQVNPHPSCHSFFKCSTITRMMIRPDNDELDMVISIALKTAPAFVIRSIISPHGKLDREVAVQTLTNRVVAALRRYELAREPGPSEIGQGTLPLFPDKATSSHD